MKSLAPNIIDDGSSKTFILSFIAIIWRRVWITSVIYSKHNNINISHIIILKCFKYNIFSDAGIANDIKPYITKALADGFLMPQFYRKNKNATKAINLFSQVYEIVKTNDKNKEYEFIRNYALEIFNNNELSREETQEITTNNSDPKNNHEITSNNFDSESKNNINFNSIIISNRICKCKLCEVIDSWDVNIDLIYSDDPFQTLLINILVSSFGCFGI